MFTKGLPLTHQANWLIWQNHRWIFKVVRVN